MRDEIRDIFATFRALLHRGTAGLVAAFAVITVARLVFHTPGWVVAYMQARALDVGDISGVSDLVAAGTCTWIMMLAGELALGAWQLGLLRSVRAYAKRGELVEGSAVDVLRRASGRYTHVLAIYAIVLLATSIGSILCGIGALAAFFAIGMSLYLVTTREQPVGDSLRNGFQIAKTRPFAVGAVVVGIVALFAVAGLLAWGLTAALAALLGAAGVLIAALLGFLVLSAASYLALLWIGSAGVVVERAGLPFTEPPGK